MSYFRLSLLGACAASLAGTGAAQGAETPGFYLDGGYQYLNIEPEGADSGVDTNGIFARLGYQLTPMLSFEADLSSGIDDGEFDFNVDEDTFQLDDNNDGDFDDLIAASGDIELNYLVGVYGRASLPLTEQLHAFGRIGYAYIDVDASVVTPGGFPVGSVEDSENGAAIGGGLKFDVNDKWSLRGDYTWYGFDNTDAGGVTIGAGYKF
ncbi:MAG: porin family protein [Pseudomonadota bacterium]